MKNSGSPVTAPTANDPGQSMRTEPLTAEIRRFGQNANRNDKTDNERITEGRVPAGFQMSRDLRSHCSTGDLCNQIPVIVKSTNDRFGNKRESETSFPFSLAGSQVLSDQPDPMPIIKQSKRQGFFAQAPA